MGPQSTSCATMPRVAGSDWLPRRAKESAKAALRGRGYELRRTDLETPAPAPVPVPSEAAEFRRAADVIIERHGRQTLETVEGLRRKYEAPVVGDVRVWELIELLALCIDPTDGRLFCTSQLVHVLQMLDAMADDEADVPDLVLAALIHDCGKVLLLSGEDPANVSCLTVPIGSYAPGVGLDNVVFQWGHDEFAYSRFVEHVPDHIAWLIRYHSVDQDVALPLMDARDRAYYDRYLRPFSYYDHQFKSPFRLPKRALNEYQDVVEDAFPKPVRF